ncbi:MAG: restriction endonuclease [Candidatus Pacebacteria bacterium]|nr:restriction endonuclease [Candidatus Paceibacterota bacterium]
MKNSNEWQRLKAEIEKTDAKIDAEVYELYDLTPAEIKTVAESISR